RCLDAESVGGSELALPGDDLDLALLGERGQPACQALDDRVLPAADGRKIEGGLAEADPVRAHRSRVVNDLCDMQQRLGGDAADVEADAAEGRALVDENDVLPEIGGAEGGGVAAGASAQNQDVGLDVRLAARIGGGFRRRARWRGLRRRRLDLDRASAA